MEIIIDFSAIPTDSAYAFGWWFIKTIGWIYPVFLYFIYAPILIWLSYIRNRYRRKRKYILLAVDIPKDNEQTPRAVEHIFAHLAGAHQVINRYNKWWDGEINDSFSFEIISLGGYIQFIIHTVAKYRDLIEAIIYAQYPDAEITEIEDYTKRWNIRFPNDQYDLFGTELKLAKDYVYPIITYQAFEDTLAGEIKDPMASMLEALTRIGPKEEIWVQFVVTPADNDWGDRAKPIVKKLIGAKVEKKKGIVDRIFDLVNFLLDSFIIGPTAEAQTKKDEPRSQMLFLTQGEKDTVSAIEHKVNKIGFNTRIRFIYLAEKSSFVRERGNQGVYGSFKQFNDLGLNSLKPDKRYITGGIVWFKKTRLIWRKNKILWRYKDRGHFLEPGFYGFVLNTEELASLWHFPLLTVKAPLLKKTESKKAEPPITLPRERAVPPLAPVKIATETSLSSPPENLPTE